MYENSSYGDTSHPGYDWNQQQSGDFYTDVQAPHPVRGSAWGGKKPAERSRGSLGVAGFWMPASALIANAAAVLLLRRDVHDFFEALLADPGTFPNSGGMANFFLFAVLMLSAGAWAVAGLAPGIVSLVFSSKEGKARNKVYSILAIVFSVCNPIAISITLNWSVFLPA